MTVIDSCIIIDVVNGDNYCEASRAAMTERARKGRLFAPDIVFSEICMAFPKVEDAQNVFRELDITLVHLSERSLYMAASSYQSFLKRNKRIGLTPEKSYKRILPDFYVGALACQEGIPLLTRDKRNWRADFPTLQILAP